MNKIKSTSKATIKVEFKVVDKHGNVKYTGSTASLSGNNTACKSK